MDLTSQSISPYSLSTAAVKCLPQRPRLGFWSKVKQGYRCNKLCLLSLLSKHLLFLLIHYFLSENYFCFMLVLLSYCPPSLLNLHRLLVVPFGKVFLHLLHHGKVLEKVIPLPLHPMIKKCRFSENHFLSVIRI